MREVNDDEVIFRVEVVFAALIYDAEVTILCGVLVREHAVDFMQLQRRRVVGVVDADGESDGVLLSHGYARRLSSARRCGGIGR